MFADRRRSSRHVINRVARLYAPGLASCDCLIIDISDGGARIYAAKGVAPDRFTLVVSGETNSRYECCVVWRLGNEFGVEFV